MIQLSAAVALSSPPLLHSFDSFFRFTNWIFVWDAAFHWTTPLPSAQKHLTRTNWILLRFFPLDSRQHFLFRVCPKRTHPHPTAPHSTHHQPRPRSTTPPHPPRPTRHESRVIAKLIGIGIMIENVRSKFSSGTILILRRAWSGLYLDICA